MTENRHAPQRTRLRAGFSLIELMVVVSITGILAAIAIPTFSGYVYKSRTSEPVHFLGTIKLKQESFRAEFGRYAPGLGGGTKIAEIDFVPDKTLVHGASLGWPQASADAAPFQNLVAHPGAGVRFGYGWVAGTPTNAGGANLDGLYSYDPPWDHYFIAQAVSDLNNDGVYCTFEVTSFTRVVWFTPVRGWD